MQGSTQESNQERSKVRAVLNSMMHCQSKDEFEVLFNNFKNDYQQRFDAFYKYFNDHWYKKKESWVKAWRKEATFHTNNYIESYHNQIKSFYFHRSRNTRVDRVVYILSQLVVADYRQEAVQVQYGYKKMHLTKQEKERKSKAENINIDQAVYMITIDDNNSNVSKPCF